MLLPGVGAAHDTMAAPATRSGLDALIPTLTQPLLGICLGMQLLFDASEEAAGGLRETAACGMVPGKVERLPASAEQPVPHMGWNQLDPLRADPLFDGIAAGDYVYFVHSYAAPVTPTHAGQPATTAAASPRPSGAAISAACSSIPNVRPPRVRACWRTSSH